jgi:hypothetical protein
LVPGEERGKAEKRLVKVSWGRRILLLRTIIYLTKVLNPVKIFLHGNNTHFFFGLPDEAEAFTMR